MKTKSKGGFSLVELMVVITIIAILAAIAIPLYSNYKERAAIIDSISIIGNVKTQISEYLNEGDNISNITFANIPTGISVINGSTSGGTIEINLSQTSPDVFSSANDTIRFIGSVNGNTTIEWSCAYNSNASDLTTSNVPSTCPNTF
ncbi:prepilin-type N-terminal cleavage/methylation domain-containing protein [Francisella sp. 19X1-34]|uniref:prepilin-type N-terminal cleavage/methylation domain-containing protein n=1 Tax=Francisella sp. 19X1-34 TaxID=3087177 RepID=UPI002E2F2F47|nr:prepilin-type N-terminal cleavage/methylation domain-containing protein [Francisella sp. 19X1-34]MED7787699.1 prepilin-type N-terminal cleavage/methylation domain-containing protein [Francisella sp. 19X1-34]